jgi:hypothetical protein
MSAGSPFWENINQNILQAIRYNFSVEGSA